MIALDGIGFVIFLSLIDLFVAPFLTVQLCRELKCLRFENKYLSNLLYWLIYVFFVIVFFTSIKYLSVKLVYWIFLYTLFGGTYVIYLEIKKERF